MSALWEAPSLASASLAARDVGAVSSRSPVGAQWEKRVSCNPARANGPSERAGSVPTAMMNELGADQPSLQAQRLHRPSRRHAELQQWRPVLSRHECCTLTPGRTAGHSSIRCTPDIRHWCCRKPSAELHGHTPVHFTAGQSEGFTCASRGCAEVGANMHLHAFKQNISLKTVHS